MYILQPEITGHGLTEDPGRKKNLEEDEDAAEDEADAQDGVEATLVEEEEARVRVEGVACVGWKTAN
jgi:hypothetical protein